MIDNQKEKLDDLDKKILNRIQKEVPLKKRPFLALAEEFRISEEEMLNRVNSLWDKGVIRRFGPIINYPAWNMSGVLVAANMPPEREEDLKRTVWEYPEITHAYIRNHKWNLWFTVIAEDDDARNAIIEDVKVQAGLKDVKMLKRSKSFKLNVNFKL